MYVYKYTQVPGLAVKIERLAFSLEEANLTRSQALVLVEDKERSLTQAKVRALSLFARFNAGIPCTLRLHQLDTQQLTCLTPYLLRRQE